jgi:short-subunit dehydrogenase
VSAGRTALITGASSGIGAAFARVCATEGFGLVLTARRQDRLEALAARLSREHGCRVDVIPCDLADPHGVRHLCDELTTRGLTIDMLVNSAGFGTAGGYVGSGWMLHGAMLQVHVTALAELTHRLLPGMLQRGYGRIVNVASFAGLVAAPAGTLYGASKTFVVSFSRSLAREVRGGGVHVTALCPGLTRSEFHDAARHTVARMPACLWMEPDVVARQGFDAVMAGTAVYVNGWINRALVLLFRVVPLPLLASAGRHVLKLARLRSRTTAA